MNTSEEQCVFRTLYRRRKIYWRLKGKQALIAKVYNKQESVNCPLLCRYLHRDV
jgi:hypothetical protein